MTKIEIMINEMESYFSECKPAPLSRNRIIVDKDRVDEMISELRLRTPEELKKCQKLLANKEAIIADAQQQAGKLVNDALLQTQELVNEHEIIQKAHEEANAIIESAYAQAQQIVDHAQMEAGDMCQSAVKYTDDMLRTLQEIIEHSIESNRSKYDSLLSSLNNVLGIVVSNRRELISSNEPSANDEAAPANEAGDYDEYSDQ